MNPQEGQIAQSPEQASQLEHQGYVKCHNQLCDWWITPEAAQAVSEAGQTYKCPRCSMSYDLNTIVGQFPREETSPFAPGGTTIAGISLQEQAQIGEDLVEHLGTIPGYGPITWWHQGGATSPSPLDGACQAIDGQGTWGIEVKTLNYDAKNLRFVPGGPKYKAMKNAHAEREGWLGVLGILVLLNYRTGKADMYARAFPLGTSQAWTDAQGRGHNLPIQGVGAFRHHNATQFVTEIPFKNPLVDPRHPAPNVYGSDLGGDYKDDIPF
jgi:hypothetical protein